MTHHIPGFPWTPVAARSQSPFFSPSPPLTEEYTGMAVCLSTLHRTSLPKWAHSGTTIVSISDSVAEWQKCRLWNQAFWIQIPAPLTKLSWWPWASCLTSLCLIFLIWKRDNSSCFYTFLTRISECMMCVFFTRGEICLWGLGNMEFSSGHF